MIYEFESDDGRRIEVDRPMAEAPPLGSCIEVGGVAYKRVLSTIQVDCIDVSGPKKSLPRWHPDARRFTAEGHPIMRTRAEAMEWAQKANVRAGYDKWQWGQA